MEACDECHFILLSISFFRLQNLPNKRHTKFNGFTVFFIEYWNKTENIESTNIYLYGDSIDLTY